MATTTNYSWDTPDDTDLVKDGAAAIRTLGSSIDTTTKNLNPQTTTGALAYRSATSNVNTSLALGTAGQVLTVNSGATAPEWASPAGAAGLTLISTTSFSAVSSQSLTNVFSTTYDNYLVLLTAFGSSTSTLITARLGVGASYDSGANYSYAYVGLNRGGGSVTNENGDAVGNWSMGPSTTDTSTTLLSTKLTIFSPFLTKATNFDLMTFSRQQMTARMGGGTHNLTTSYTDLQLSASTGTITGTISFYGYAK